MQKKKNKAFSLFYLIVGLVLCLPIASYAAETTDEDWAQVIPVQESTAPVDLTGEVINPKENPFILPFYSNIATPIGPVLETRKQTDEPKDEHKGGEK